VRLTAVVIAAVCGALLVPLAGASSGGAPKARIVAKPIPFPAKRRLEMQAYAKRHYGIDSWRLRNPKVIVEHVTVSSTFGSAFATFAADRPDAELHELPGTCAHFVVDTDGTIYQLVPLEIMCRHTWGSTGRRSGSSTSGSRTRRCSATRVRWRRRWRSRPG
jgi:N-acetylmuramoyl-L-alanine amidase